MLRALTASFVLAAVLFPVSTSSAGARAVHATTPNLTGWWVVTTVCHPRCYANPKLTDNSYTGPVYLSVRKTDTGIYFYAGKNNRFSEGLLVLVPLGAGSVALYSHI
jgi:hypothetical protein